MRLTVQQGAANNATENISAFMTDSVETEASPLWAELAVSYTSAMKYIKLDEIPHPYNYFRICKGFLSSFVLETSWEN